MNARPRDRSERAAESAPPASSSWSFSDAAVWKAIELVDQTGVVAELRRWRDAERHRLGRHAGGRPETFPAEALWVAMTLAVVHDLPQHFTTYADILFRRISATMRTRLDVPDPPDPNDEHGWKAVVRNVRTRFHSLIGPIDPSDLPKNRRLEAKTFRAAVDRRQREQQLTDEVLQSRHERLTWILNRVLEASLQQLPPEILRRWHGDAAVDATAIPAFARPDRREPGREARAKRSAIVHSADADAGYYIRTTDDDQRGDKHLKAAEWCYEATIIVAGSDDPNKDQPFPTVVIGMAPLHRPATDVGNNAITALTSVAERRYPTGRLAGDRAYTNCKPETYQLPARALGWTHVLDYKADQLGIQESYAGANLIEGAWYCPRVPDSLVNATIAYRNGEIDWGTWQARIEEREYYRLQAKTRPDEQGHQRLMSPAAPGAPTVGCEIKPQSVTSKPTSPRIQLTQEFRDHAPKICTQGSVTFPPEAGAKYLQDLHYGSTEWIKAYASLRNAVEGINGLVKDGAHSALGDPTRRRVRGVAAQSVFAALAFMATNLRQINSFLRKARPDKAGVLRRPRPPRRRTTPLSTWTPEVLARSGAPPP